MPTTETESGIPRAGSDRLDFAISQVWGPAIERGELRATLSGRSVPGWDTREAYWVVPTLSSARLLVPCPRKPASRSLTEFASLRDPQTRAVRHVLGSAAALGLPISRHILRITARSDAPPTTPQALGRAVGCADAVAALGVYTSANAKPTMDLRNRSGDAIGFAKLAWNPVTTAALANEAASLKNLAGGLSGVIEVPRLLTEGYVSERRFLVTAPLPRGIANVPMAWSSLSDEEACGPGTVIDRRSFTASLQVDSVRDVLATATAVTPANLLAQARALTRSVLATGLTVPMADFWHGDFSPWNMGRDTGGRLWLFDWETAARDAPAGLDAIHWFAHSRGGLDAETIVTRVAAAADRAGPILRMLGHSQAGASAVAAWYAATFVTGEIRFAEALQSWERVKHSPAILEELLEWGQKTLPDRR